MSSKQFEFTQKCQIISIFSYTNEFIYAQCKRRHRIANIEKCGIDIPLNSSNARCHTVVKLLWNTEYLCTKFNSNFRHKSEWNTVVWPHNSAHRASSIHFKTCATIFLPYANDAWNWISRCAHLFLGWILLMCNREKKWNENTHWAENKKNPLAVCAGFRSSNFWNVPVKNI